VVMNTIQTRWISTYDGSNNTETQWNYPSGMILVRVFLQGYASFTLANGAAPLFVALSFASNYAGVWAANSAENDIVLAEICATYPLGAALADREYPVARQQFDFLPGLRLRHPGILYLNAYCGDADAIVRGECIAHWLTA